MDGAKVGVFEESNKVGLRGFLEGHDGGRLESKVTLEVLGNLTYQALEGKFADQKFSGFLVLTDLTKGNGTGSVTMRLLDTSGGRGVFAGSFGGKLLAGGFASGGFTCGLLMRADTISKMNIAVTEMVSRLERRGSND